MPEVVAIIPCRKGSKRLKGKNKRMFYGKPLFAWTVELAFCRKEIDKIIITTDDEDILMYCYEHYNDFGKVEISERPTELAQDDTPIWKVIEDLYAHNYIDEYSTIILLQPTSPLRQWMDIEIPLSLHKYYGKGVVSVSKQDDWIYKRNGSVYVDSYHNWIKNGTADGLCYLMPYERSIDIDTEEDFKEAENIINKEMEEMFERDRERKERYFKMMEDGKDNK